MNASRDQKYWDDAITSMKPERPRYDLWLDKYRGFLEKSTDVPVIDLGCGWGSDSLYLWERGYPVISCDFSHEALNRIGLFMPGAVTMRFDMLDGLLFGDAAAYVVVADLCLHYFSWADTCRIVRDIERILSGNGILLCRVNSTGDINFGAGTGIEIEDHFYDTGTNSKRFFDRAQLVTLFEDLKIIHLDEYELLKYAAPKMVWEIAAMKKGDI